MWDVMSSLLSWAGSLAYPWSWGWVQLLLETKWMPMGEGRLFKENQDAISSARRKAAGQAKTTDVHSDSFSVNYSRKSRSKLHPESRD